MLEKDGKDITIEKLRYNKYGQQFKIWKDRFDAVIIRHRNVLLTKVKYVHNNPVRYGIVEKIEDWKYSSAGFYKTGIEGLLPVKHAWDII